MSFDIDFDRVTENIYVGSVPTNRADVKTLLSCGIDAVLNLQTDLDMRLYSIDWQQMLNYYAEAGIEVVRHPIRDFDPEDLRNNLRGAALALSELLNKGHRVYVHCTAGINRSPTVVIAYLHWYLGHSLDEATDVMKLSRFCEPYPHLIEGI
ncbi:MAG: dual specificity protein phosphatase family protein [Acidobacteriota bacterium]|nr:dual specificity protein phosphatase family protein [Blastocatellia bacterium]MDW8412868.1 dual specificity protein phosphatase family protein [Acidobacteriota bacterium]